MAHARPLHFFLTVALVAGAASTIACGPAHVQVVAETPQLVSVAPGIWLVENNPYAVYYADGFYWRFDNGLWYRSTYYDGGFGLVDVAFVPPIVIGGYRPTHVHYRPRGHVQHRTITRDHHSPRPARRPPYQQPRP